MSVEDTASQLFAYTGRSTQSRTFLEGAPQSRTVPLPPCVLRADGVQLRPTAAARHLASGCVRALVSGSSKSSAEGVCGTAFSEDIANLTQCPLTSHSVLALTGAVTVDS